MHPNCRSCGDLEHVLAHVFPEQGTHTAVHVRTQHSTTAHTHRHHPRGRSKQACVHVCARAITSRRVRVRGTAVTVPTDRDHEEHASGRRPVLSSTQRHTTAPVRDHGRATDIGNATSEGRGCCAPQLRRSAANGDGERHAVRRACPWPVHAPSHGGWHLHGGATDPCPHVRKRLQRGWRGDVHAGTSCTGCTSVPAAVLRAATVPTVRGEHAVVHARHGAESHVPATAVRTATVRAAVPRAGVPRVAG